MERFRTVQILGIVNITRDSFSDGGRHMDPAAAVEHALRLSADGADIIDLGAESTHPDAEDVSAEEEIARLVPVIERLHDAGVRVSVDTCKPAVMRRVLELGVALINDVTALRHPDAVAAVRDSDARLILMHSTAAHARAERADVPAAGMVERVLGFFEKRLDELEDAGIARHRLILDPGMGLFLSRDPAASLNVLRELPRLAALGLPVLISTSRKGFLADLVERATARRPKTFERGPATLATELWSVAHGASFIRTHDPRALRDALAIWHELQ